MAVGGQDHHQGTGHCDGTDSERGENRRVECAQRCGRARRSAGEGSDPESLSRQAPRRRDGKSGEQHHVSGFAAGGNFARAGFRGRTGGSICGLCGSGNGAALSAAKCAAAVGEKEILSPSTTEKQALSIAFAVARKIAKRGVSAFGMFARAFAKLEGDLRLEFSRRRSQNRSKRLGSRRPGRERRNRILDFDLGTRWVASRSSRWWVQGLSPRGFQRGGV